MSNGYTGKITNKGNMEVKAPNQTGNGGKAPKVTTGGDLRAK